MVQSSGSQKQDIGAILRAGLAHHRAGRLDQAEAAYHAVLERRPGEADAHNLLCALYQQRGDIARALEHGKSAVAANGKAADFWNTYAAALRRAGQLNEAVEAFEAALARDPGHLDARQNLAGILAERGKYDAAAEAYRAVIANAPDALRAHINLGHVLRMGGDLDGAITAWRDAVQVTPAAPDGWINLVGVLSDAGRFTEAEEAFAGAEKNNALVPAIFANRARMELLRGAGDAAIRFAERGLSADRGHIGCAVALAMALLETGDVDRAETLARQITQNAPDEAEGWAVLAATLDRLRRTDEAIAAYEAVLARVPGDVEARANLADLAERTNDLEHARALIDRVLEAAPGHPFANRVAATLSRRRGDAAAGIARLEPVADAAASPSIRQGIRFELGRLHDREGDAAKAFVHFAEANRIQAERPAARRFEPANYRRDIADMRAALSSEWVAQWTPPLEDAGDAPVFLVGFPRSGTTLLDQILDSHPGIQVAEEKPMMEDLKRMVAERGGYPAAMASLGADDLRALRARYWSRAGDFVPREEGTLFVDKLPLNLEKAALIHRVFPDARFILALRHPADCVLSCFMQAFRPNIAMNNFHTVEDAARLYDQVFSLWEESRAVLPLDVHVSRYEDLVADFRTQLEGLLGFLGLPWDDAVLDYAANAQRRGQINTPSYNQVTEPIYTRARGRWTKYREEMAGALDILQPWIERYGYDTFESL